VTFAQMVYTEVPIILKNGVIAIGLCFGVEPSNNLSAIRFHCTDINKRAEIIEKTEILNK